eukprot:571196_1
MSTKSCANCHRDIPIFLFETHHQICTQSNAPHRHPHQKPIKPSANEETMAELLQLQRKYEALNLKYNQQTHELQQLKILTQSSKESMKCKEKNKQTSDLERLVISLKDSMPVFSRDLQQTSTEVAEGWL